MDPETQELRQRREAFQKISLEGRRRRNVHDALRRAHEYRARQSKQQPKKEASRIRANADPSEEEQEEYTERVKSIQTPWHTAASRLKT